jgi:hypothetical protein
MGDLPPLRRQARGAPMGRRKGIVMGILPDGPRRRAAEPPFVDQVGRLREFRARHPEVLITSPTQNGTLTFCATWLAPSPDPDGEGSPQEMKHSDLRTLLDCLEPQFRDGATP